MKLSTAVFFLQLAATANGQLVKMCLEDIFPSGHARSDPIISQSCASSHVHTFYGPQNFHPDTTYEDIRDTPNRFSTSPWVENQSLYWHPTVYEVTENGDGTKTYTRARTKATAYYRWDQGAIPAAEAFPPGFRMIAHSNDFGADVGEIGDIDDGNNLIVECCRDGTQDCEVFDFLTFPTIKCDLMEIFFSMPTCWDGESLGDDNNHKSHMAYTTNGKVNGPCPAGFPVRLPQVELNVNVGIGNYDGTTKSYELSDGASVWHVDFFNGWQEGKLQEIIDECPFSGNPDPRNPDCGCTPNLSDTDFLTRNEEAPGFGYVCDSSARQLIIDEANDVTTSLPMGSCQGPNLILKSWDQITDGLFNTCDPFGDGPGDSNHEEEEEEQDEEEEDEEEEPEDEEEQDEEEEEEEEEEDEQEDDENEEEEEEPEECEDDESFRFKGKPRKSCRWIGKKNKRKKRFCRKKLVAASCPETCGVCSV